MDSRRVFYDRELQLLSVITPVQPSRARFLEAAWLSLLAQDFPEGWRWEWLVESDGPALGLAESLGVMTANDQRARFETTASQLGAPTTRNAALSRARASSS